MIEPVVDLSHEIALRSVNDRLRLPDVGGKAGAVVFKRLRACADLRQRLCWQRDAVPLEHGSQCLTVRFVNQGPGPRPFVRGELEEQPNELFALDDVALSILQEWQALQGRQDLQPPVHRRFGDHGSTAPASLLATALVITGN